ncbi:transglutaminase family protein, partial [Candidatus Woesebacteria bacterium]|nr:transglutaminase family protein [Candidatus Woesebacteria bacterium]
MLSSRSLLQQAACAVAIAAILVCSQSQALSIVQTAFAQEDTSPELRVTSKTSESFRTDATSSYTVSASGSVRVEHRFTITNLKPTTYLKQYSIKLQFPSVAEITATDQGQNIAPYVVKDGPVTTVSLNFSDDVVGEGKTRVFTIAYSTKDISVGSGNVLEIRIPALSGAQESQHAVYINIPLRYGKPVRTSPEPSKQTITADTLQLQYDQFPTGGISALFGSEQYYSLTTQYQLVNTSSSLGYTQIALPPDTSYQRMEYQLLEPKPENMFVDEDGNWIATYLLPANSKVAVALEAVVKVSLEPDSLVPIVQPLADHTSEKPFWQSKSSVIQSFAQPMQLRSIYDDVIKALTYDAERVAKGDITTRLGAEGALLTPAAAVCQEYADLLIAGWRSAGIPSRRLNGYAFSQNKEIRPLSFRGTVLHAWVDYFDQASQRWRMVDPTWEDTTGGVDYFSEFDLNHIVLSINGVSSSEPAPAGSYTESPEEATLDVVVVAATDSAKPSFDITLKPATALGFNIPGSYVATIQNTTGRAWYDTYIRLTAEPNVSITPAQLTSTFLPF